MFGRENSGRGKLDRGKCQLDRMSLIVKLDEDTLRRGNFDEDKFGRVEFGGGRLERSVMEIR